MTAAHSPRAGPACAEQQSRDGAGLGDDGDGGATCPAIEQ